MTLGVSCQWYSVNFPQKLLQRLAVKTHGYTEVYNYIAHIPKPKYDVIKDGDKTTKNLLLTEEICNQIKEEIEKTLEK